MSQDRSRMEMDAITKSIRDSAERAAASAQRTQETLERMIPRVEDNASEPEVAEINEEDSSLDARLARIRAKLVSINEINSRGEK